MRAMTDDIDIKIETDPTDPTRVHISMPDPWPSAMELAAMRAVVREVIAKTPPLPGESVDQFRARVREICFCLATAG